MESDNNSGCDENPKECPQEVEPSAYQVEGVCGEDCAAVVKGEKDELLVILTKHHPGGEPGDAKELDTYVKAHTSLGKVDELLQSVVGERGDSESRIEVVNRLIKETREKLPNCPRPWRLKKCEGSGYELVDANGSRIHDVSEGNTTSPDVLDEDVARFIIESVNR